MAEKLFCKLKKFPKISVVDSFVRNSSSCNLFTEMALLNTISFAEILLFVVVQGNSVVSEDEVILTGQVPNHILKTFPTKSNRHNFIGKRAWTITLNQNTKISNTSC